MKDLPVTITSRHIEEKPQYRGVVMVEIDIAYPRVWVKGHPAGQAISFAYDRIARRFYAFASRKMFPDAIGSWKNSRKNQVPFHPHLAKMVYEVPFNQAGLLSIYYDQDTYTGGAHGNTMRRADTWQVPEARRLSLNDFFENAGYRNVVFRAIFAEIQKQPESYFEDFQKNVFQYFDSRHFYLTPQGFAFFFPLYSIAPYSSGIPVFLIPYECFGDLLKIPLAPRALQKQD